MNMHADKCVVAIKVGGKVLRETGDIVTLPFSSEYSIFIKNLNSVRAQFKVSIDGDDITGNSSFVLGPNSSMEVERSIKSGNMNEGNRLKFIERTAAVEAHRGIGAEDGLVRVEMWRELVVPQFVPNDMYDYPYWIYRHPYERRSYTYKNPFFGGVSKCASGENSASGTTVGVNAMSDSYNTSTSDAGITVQGSHSNQRFNTVQGFSLETQSAVVVLRLRGMVGGAVVASPMTVDRRPKCQTCGRNNKAVAKFCAECGTGLEVFA